MIAVDTSALMAILLGEPEADACMAVLETETEVLISAVAVAEALIVAAHRDVADEMAMLIEGLVLTIVTVTSASAGRVAQAYDAWGKGNHSAGLNFGDCFSYEVARQHHCALLYVGDDFAKTDVQSAIGK